MNTYRYEAKLTPSTASVHYTFPATPPPGYEFDVIAFAFFYVDFTPASSAVVTPPLITPILCVRASADPTDNTRPSPSDWLSIMQPYFYASNAAGGNFHPPLPRRIPEGQYVHFQADNVVTSGGIIWLSLEVAERHREREPYLEVIFPGETGSP